MIVNTTYLARFTGLGRVLLLAVVPGQHLVELTRHGGRNVVHAQSLFHLVFARLPVGVRLLHGRLDGVVATVPQPVTPQPAGLDVRTRVVRAHGRNELPTGVYKALMITIIIIIIFNIIVIIVIVIIIIIIINIIIIIIGTVGARGRAPRARRGRRRRCRRRRMRCRRRRWARALAYLSGARRLPEGHVHRFAGSRRVPRDLGHSSRRRRDRLRRRVRQRGRRRGDPAGGGGGGDRRGSRDGGGGGGGGRCCCCCCRRRRR